MKLIIDAQLPSSLADFFPNEEIIHTSQLKDGNLTPDRSINEISVSEKCAVITKEYFERNAAKIVELLQQNSFIILEPDTIRILD